MASKSSTGLRDRFQTVEASHELNKLREEIENLQDEINELRSGKLNQQESSELQQQIEQLTLQLADSGGKHKILLSLIDRDDNQPRQIFPDSLICERAESLKRNGQKTPIILIPMQNGRYRLFDGELRTLGAKALGWNSIESVFLEQDEIPEPQEMFRGQIITSIHSQRLHDLDLAEALIKLVINDYSNFQGQDEEIPGILLASIRRLQRADKLRELSNIRIADIKDQEEWLQTAGLKNIEEQQIFRIILGLNLNPVSINSNVFPLLKLENDIKEVIQSHGLEPSKAKELNRISSKSLGLDESLVKDIRKEAIKKVIEEKLSVSEIRKLVSEITDRYNSDKGDRISANKILKSICEIPVEKLCDQDLKDIRKALREKLAVISEQLKTSKNNK
jgi:ParB family transcriptional regulator, chromosome partitioning protein